MVHSSPCCHPKIPTKPLISQSWPMISQEKRGKTILQHEWIMGVTIQMNSYQRKFVYYLGFKRCSAFNSSILRQSSIILLFQLMKIVFYIFPFAISDEAMVVCRYVYLWQPRLLCADTQQMLRQHVTPLLQLPIISSVVLIRMNKRPCQSTQVDWYRQGKQQ